MFRLLVKIHQVNIRLRQEVDVQIVIKKGTENYVIPQKAKLSQGKAILNAHAQFFISAKDPVFDIYVMIIIGSGKRFAGMCQLDLNDWQQGSSNTTTSLLQKSPDNQAKIMFDFLFLSTEIVESNRGLISLNQLQSEKKLESMKEAEQKNVFLTDENKRLTQELLTLKKVNNDLTSNHDQMTQQSIKRSTEFESTYKQKCEQMEESQNNLSMMKQRMLKLEEIVNNFGRQEIKDQMKNLQYQYDRYEQIEKTQ